MTSGSSEHTNRRRFLKGGAALSGAAVVTGGLAAPVVRAQDAGQSRLQQVLDRGKLVVGTGSTNPPWHYEDADGQLIGFDIEMAKLLARGLFELTDEQLADRNEWSKYLAVNAIEPLSTNQALQWSAISSTDLKYCRCTGAMVVMIAMSGCTMRDSGPISPA